MASTRTRLVGPVAGVLFVALSVVSGLMIFSDSPGGSKFSDQEIVSWFSGHKDRIQAGGFLWALAALAFVVFLAALRNRLRAQAGPETGIGGVAVAAGTAFVVLVSVGHGVIVAIASSLDYAKPFHVDPLTARLVSVTAFWMDLYAVVAAAALVGAVAVAALRGAFLPRWIWPVGVVGTVLLVLSLLAAPWGLFILLAWTLVVSAALWFSPPAGEPAVAA
jgi:hypothetical protein